MQKALQTARTIYLVPIFIYRMTFTKLWRLIWPPDGICRFTPTCSRYFVDAVYRWGIIKGTAMGLWRICRCNPWSRGGYDPVAPEKAPEKTPENADSGADDD